MRRLTEAEKRKPKNRQQAREQTRRDIELEIEAVKARMKSGVDTDTWWRMLGRRHDLETRLRALFMRDITASRNRARRLRKLKRPDRPSADLSAFLPPEPPKPPKPAPAPEPPKPPKPAPAPEPLSERDLQREQIRAKIAKIDEALAAVGARKLPIWNAWDRTTGTMITGADLARLDGNPRWRELKRQEWHLKKRQRALRTRLWKLWLEEKAEIDALEN